MSLIQIEQRQVGGESMQTVNARELHAFLEIGRVFAAWIPERIEQYGFKLSVDFEVFSHQGNNLKGGRPAKEYALTMDMAKELAMVERNEKGKQARQYFIECERRAKAGQASAASLLADPAALRAALIEYSGQVIELTKQVQVLEPKAQFHDAVADAINGQTVQEVAKVLKTGPNKLFEFLREEKMLMGNNLPYQAHIDAGHFRVIEKQFKDRRGEIQTYTRTLVTGKGLILIQKRLAGTGKLPLVAA